MPRQETFLVSSVLLSFRQAAAETIQMLKEARKLVEKRERRKGRRRLYLPRKMNWRKWLALAGEDDVHTLPQTARKEARKGKGPKAKEKEDMNDGESDDEISEKPPLPGRLDEEPSEEPPAVALSPPDRVQEKQKSVPKKREDRVRDIGLSSWFRELTANFMESTQHSEHFSYALKLAIAVFLASFPAFYGPWNAWYSTSRANWASLQLVLVFEVAIGPSFSTFLVRAIGVILGCFWGYVAYELGRGQLPAIVVILAIGIIPSAYVQLATPYVKAGMISIVSMCVVALGKSRFYGLFPYLDGC